VPDIRPYRADDRDALYDICVRTADAGEDARGRYSDDHLMGDLFAVSYATLEPGLAFVLDDGRGHAVGYIVGTSDTRAFVKRYAAEWTPIAGRRYGDDERDRDMLQLLHHPEHMIVPALADYPAHLHMNVLPGYQRQGHGRGLMETFLAAANRAGAERVWLGMLTANVKARAFYDRVGFTELSVPDPGPLTYLGRATRA
jgi:ribosomal protein S18 acetylase RimI-like enzyme